MFRRIHYLIDQQVSHSMVVTTRKPFARTNAQPIVVYEEGEKSLELSYVQAKALRKALKKACLGIESTCRVPAKNLQYPGFVIDVEDE